jgi:hypothetical protein
MNMKLPSFNVKEMMREAGSTIHTQMTRVVQVSVVLQFSISFIDLLNDLN